MNYCNKKLASQCEEMNLNFGNDNLDDWVDVIISSYGEEDNYKNNEKRLIKNRAFNFLKKNLNKYYRIIFTFQCIHQY